jgi:hypothetical protein
VWHEANAPGRRQGSRRPQQLSTWAAARTVLLIVAEVAASVKGPEARSRKPVHSRKDQPMRSITNLCPW